MKTKKTPRCRKCGSANVSRDAAAAWDGERQEWTFKGLYDAVACADCGSEDVEWVEDDVLFTPWRYEPAEAGVRNEYHGVVVDSQDLVVARVYGDDSRAGLVARLLTLAPLLLKDAEDVAGFRDVPDMTLHALRTMIASLRNRVAEIKEVK